MFYVSKSFILFLAIFICLIIGITVIACYLLLVRPLENRLEEQSSVLYSILKKHIIYDDKLYVMSDDITSVQQNIKSLTSSIGHVIKENQTIRGEKVYPSPQLAELIQATIKEQITIEMLLSNKMRIANKDSVGKIIENVSKTYPNVDVEYLTKKCLAMIELSTQSQNKPPQEQE